MIKGQVFCGQWPGQWASRMAIWPYRMAISPQRLTIYSYSAYVMLLRSLTYYTDYNVIVLTLWRPLLPYGYSYTLSVWVHGRQKIQIHRMLYRCTRMATVGMKGLIVIPNFHWISGIAMFMLHEWPWSSVCSLWVDEVFVANKRFCQLTWRRF